MAKTPSRYLAHTGIDFLYISVSDMPWDEIEKAAGKRFKAREREEILKCTNQFSWEYGWYEGGASVREVNDLRNRLVKVASEFCQLADRFGPLNHADVDKQDRKTTDALAIMYGAREYSFRDEFHQTALAAQRLVSGLKAQPYVDVDETQKSPEVAGLAAFIWAVLELADPSDARNKFPGSLEHSRWGIAVGPQSKVFRDFTSAVLGRELTQNQIREGWKQALANSNE